MKKFRVEIVYEIPFLYLEIEATNEEEARVFALDKAREEYENETCFDIDEVIKSVKELPVWKKQKSKKQKKSFVTGL